MDIIITWEPLAASYDENDNGKLDRRERRALPDSAFALPRQRELPLVDADLTREAVAELDQLSDVSEEEHALATTNIRAAAAHYGVDLFPDGERHSTEAPSRHRPNASAASSLPVRHFSAWSSQAIREALRDDPSATGAAMRTALRSACAEARINRLSAGDVLIAFRTLWSQIGPPTGVAAEEWARRYTTTLDICLAEYFSVGSPVR